MTLDNEESVTNGHPASKASVQTVARQVERLSQDLISLREALVGVPGISKGALGEIREDNQQIRDQWGTLQSTLPTTINAAITAADNKRARVIVTGVRSWWVTVAASVVSGVIVASLILILHLGVTVAK